MPRIPDTEIDRIKRDTDLAALVRSRGISLERHGGNGHLVGKCPFHDEDEASFIVTPAKGLFHCMGCGAAGNAIQFVQKFDGVSFRHAFEVLADGKAFTPRKDQPLKHATVPRLEAPVSPDAEDAELFDQVVDYYHQRLLATPAALDYLKGRGLYDATALRAFRLGFADRTLGLRLPAMNRKDGSAIRTRLQKLGLIRESGHEHFNGSVVLPVFDAEGRVAEMYGRKISPKLRKGTPLHLYLPGPHAGIWNVEALHTPELILCEAPLDALTFWVNGIRNVTFIYGTEGFPDYLFDAILQHRVKSVRLAYDADEAGNRAAKRDAERLSAHGIQVYRVKFPWGMDVNDYAQKVTPAAKSLRVAVDSAEWVGEVVCGKRRVASVRRPDTPSCADARASSSLAARAANEEATPSTPDTRHLALSRMGEYHTLTLGARHYRVGGLEKNNSLEVLKVSVRLAVHPQPRTKNEEPGTADEVRFHLDSFDMTRDGERRRFIERAAEETGLEKELIKRDLGRLLLALEEEQQQRLNQALAPDTRHATPAMTSAEREEALVFLQSPDLIAKIDAAFDDYGLVGEETNRLAAYLACTSRKLDKPLAVIVQSTSAAGKSTLMEAVLSMFPEEERVQYSAMTGQSLYYLGETDLKHKVLAIVEEEGAEKAGYALKLLQSEGELTIASTGKDPTTGRMETQEYHVEGPVMIFLTTTAIDIDEELQNRCLTLTVDESREQTERIHALQRKARTLEGLKLKKQRQKTLNVLRNIQRLLQPVDVVNPWADQLTFTAERTRTRRDHEKYLTLIDAIALLHQHQRPREKVDPSTELGTGEGGEFIRVTLDDIELANRIAPELLGRSLDELPPQSRRLLDHIKALVRDICKREDIEQHLALFSRRQLCESTGWTYSQVKRHLIRLQELEHTIPRYGGMGSTMRYELLVDANETADTAPQIGLLHVAKLRESDSTTITRTPSEATLTPPCQNRMARLSPVKSASNANLATLPGRTSGAPAEVGAVAV
ncbi:MAG: toprim domain-containing protein [Sedimentisphaerales bacterium]|nr:toprim domain-containing protein [Sedimentisphaerales bacterium]